MTTASTQLRALEGEIAELENAPSSIRQFRKSKLCDKALTIAKELEKALAHEVEERDYARKELAECNKDTSAEIQSLRTENATLKRRLDEAKRAVADEPELPGDMPDEMWDAIKGDRDGMNEALKLTVRLTKQNILHRITEIDKL